MKILLRKKLATAIAAATLFSVNAGALERTPKIVGGADATPNTYPWMSSLQIKEQSEHICGATLVSSTFAVTAAHCVVGESADNLQLVVGEYNLKDGADSGVNVSVSQVYIFPDYNDETSDNDIALLQLADPVANTPISIISSATLAGLSGGTSLTVMGWGVTSEEGEEIPDKLQEVNVDLVDRSSCNTSIGEEFGEDNPITENMVCAGIEEGGKDSCYGDSGGPLVYKLDGQYYQVGVVSFGAECGAPGLPGVYANAANYTTWIEAAVAGNPTGADLSQFDTDDEWDDDFDEGDFDDGDFDEDWDFADFDGYPCERKKRSLEENIIEDLENVIGYIEDELYDEGCDFEESLFSMLDIPEEIILLPDSQATVTEPVEISNFTGEAFTIENILIEGDSEFQLESNSCIGATVAEDESCTINVSYNPAANGSSVAELLIDIGAEDVLDIIFTGALMSVVDGSESVALVMKSGGESPWVFDPSDDSLSVSGGDDGDLSILSVDVEGPGLLEFSSLVSGGLDTHFLVFGVDGEPMFASDAMDESLDEEIYLSDGNHTVFWALVSEGDVSETVTASVQNIRVTEGDGEYADDDLDEDGDEGESDGGNDDESASDEKEIDSGAAGNTQTLGEQIGEAIDEAKSSSAGSVNFPLMLLLVIFALIRRRI